MLETGSKYVTVDGLRMHYRVRGPKDAPPLLLLHGIMGNAWEWDTAIDLLMERFRVYAPDQRGHGRTAWERPYTAPQMGEDAAGFVQALDLWDVTLVGHSMGGMAGAFAVANHPSRFGRMVVLDIGPSSLGGQVAARVAAALRYFGQRTYPGTDYAAAEWLLGDPYARADLIRNYVDHGLKRGRDGLYRWRYDAEGLMQFVREGAEPDAIAAALRRAVLPTLVVRGEHSDVLSPAGAAQVMDLLACGDLRVIRGAAHDLGVQQPEAVAAAVLEFAGGQGSLAAEVPRAQDDGHGSRSGAGYVVALGDRRVALL